ncbi:lysosomal L-cystine transporter-like protein [Amylocarpus encephaloides]|uniref:Lysosomal L-cystine transporter-like protein n=1 Tax=Amylocarpus encephaloides TaxID=45428 RepID=A0A9P7Y7P2_9HELO|nr:lysosomal L-cystine transporter-like protein [Amylocarpus encephaloides]
MADSSDDSSGPLESVSFLFGWVYFLCWSLSFYPQPILNLRRGSTTGTTIDFPAINVLGFIAYFLSNASFLYSPRIREEYALRHHGLTPTVQFNDLAFAGHAVIVSAITLSQFWPSLWGFEKRARRDPGVRVSKGILGIIIGSLVGVAAVTGIVSARKDEDPKTAWAWIDAIYALSYVKLVITLVKYMPQVSTNYRNRSTEGWSILQILLDFAGGVFSILQLIIDSYLQGKWDGLTGNPVKLALGNVSIFFDIIFMIQHYCLYNDTHGKAGEDDTFQDEERRDERIE